MIPETAPSSPDPVATAELTTLDFKPRRRPGPVSKIAQLTTELQLSGVHFVDQIKCAPAYSKALQIALHAQP